MLRDTTSRGLCVRVRPPHACCPHNKGASNATTCPHRHGESPSIVQHIYVCMCMHACMYVCMYVCMHVCMLFVCMYVHTICTYDMNTRYTLVYSARRYGVRLVVYVQFSSVGVGTV